MARNIMREFRLTEISGVDRPAQKAAKAKIMKRDAPTKTVDGKGYPASDWAYVPDPEKPSTWKLRLTAEPGGDPDPRIVGAAAAALGPGYRGQKVQLPDGVRSAVVARVRAAWRKANPETEDKDMPEGIAKSIIADEVVEAIAKADTSQFHGATTFGELMTSTREQQARWAVNEKLYPLMDTLGDSIRTIIADTTKTTDTKAQMIKQSVDEFTAAALDVLPDAEEEVGEEVAKLFNEPEFWLLTAGVSGTPIGKKEKPMPNEPTLQDLAKSVAGLGTAVEAILNRLDKAETLTPEEKKFADSLDETKRKEFLAAEAKEREGMMAKRDDTAGDVVYKAENGDVFTKSDDPRLVEFAKRADRDRQIAKAEREHREKVEFTKRADDEFGNVAGTTEDKVALLKAMSTMDDGAKSALEAVLKQAQALNAGNMTTLGHGSGQVAKGSTGDQLEKKAEAVAKAEGISFAKAYAKVLDTDEGQRLYEQDRAARPGFGG